MAGPYNLSQNLTANNTAPAESCASITPNDSTDLPGGTCRALFVGTGGNLNIDDAFGNTVLFTGVSAGILPVRVKRVRSSSTSATNLVALY